jgi:hypothetical protein
MWGAGLPRRVLVGRGRGGGNGAGASGMSGAVSELSAVRPSRRRGGRRGSGGRGIGSRDGRLEAGSASVQARSVRFRRLGVWRGDCVLLRGPVRDAASAGSWHALRPGQQPDPRRGGGQRPASRHRVPVRERAGPPSRRGAQGGPFSAVRASLMQRRMPIRAFQSPARCRRSGRTCRRWRERASGFCAGAKAGGATSGDPAELCARRGVRALLGDEPCVIGLELVEARAKQHLRVAGR